MLLGPGPGRREVGDTEGTDKGGEKLGEAVEEPEDGRHLERGL